jgi:hypothetical protein
MWVSGRFYFAIGMGWGKCNCAGKCNYNRRFFDCAAHEEAVRRFGQDDMVWMERRE